MKMFFISRHQLTEDQVHIAADTMAKMAPEDAEYICCEAGDVDAFDEQKVISLLHSIKLQDENALVVSVHPLVFNEAIEMFGKAGVFNNVNRAKIGEKPQFECTELAVRYRD